MGTQRVLFNRTLPLEHSEHFGHSGCAVSGPGNRSVSGLVPWLQREFKLLRATGD